MAVSDTVVEKDVRDSRRSAERRSAICQAVYELLGKVGYDRMTMDAIANQAKASKATIYRMWVDKPELVADAIKCHFGPTPDPADTGSLRGDLMALMTTACELTDSEAGEVMAGVITASAHDTRLSEVLGQTLFEGKQTLHSTIIRRAVERGELAPEADPALMHEVMHSMITGRKMWCLGPLDDEFAGHIVDDVLIPVLTYRKRPQA
jgi:AcrR family transcriptional regulator